MQHDNEPIIQVQARRSDDPNGAIILGCLIMFLTSMVLAFWGVPEGVRNVAAIPLGLYILTQVVRAIPMFVLGMIAVLMKEKPLRARYFWITLAIQIVLLWVVPLPLRPDGRLRYVIRQDGAAAQTITGTGLRFLMLAPGFPLLDTSIEVQDLRLHTDQINCLFPPVQVPQALNGCENNLWTISIETRVTDNSFNHFPPGMTQNEFTLYVNRHVCGTLRNSAATRELHERRVDILHDESARSTISKTVEQALDAIDLQSDTPPVVTALMTSQPPADVCGR